MGIHVVTPRTSHASHFATLLSLGCDRADPTSAQNAGINTRQEQRTAEWSNSSPSLKALNSPSPENHQHVPSWVVVPNSQHLWWGRHFRRTMDTVPLCAAQKTAPNHKSTAPPKANRSTTAHRCRHRRQTLPMKSWLRSLQIGEVQHITISRLSWWLAVDIFYLMTYSQPR